MVHLVPLRRRLLSGDDCQAPHKAATLLAGCCLLRGLLNSGRHSCFAIIFHQTRVIIPFTLRNSGQNSQRFENVNVEILIYRIDLRKI